MAPSISFTWENGFGALQWASRCAKAGLLVNRPPFACLFREIFETVTPGSTLSLSEQPWYASLIVLHIDGQFRSEGGAASGSKQKATFA